MAIADDFSIAVNGDIRYTGSTANYTVLEFHEWLRDLADDGSVSVSGDNLDITFSTPSVRKTDNIITLNSPYNIDDTAAQLTGLDVVLLNNHCNQGKAASLWRGLLFIVFY